MKVNFVLIEKKIINENIDSVIMNIVMFKYLRSSIITMNKE